MRVGRKKKAEKVEEPAREIKLSVNVGTQAEPEWQEIKSFSEAEVTIDVPARGYGTRCPGCGHMRLEPTVGVVNGRPVCRVCWEAR